MLKIDKTTNGDVIVGGQNVIRPNIRASNGIIHGIDGVITDPSARSRRATRVRSIARGK